MCSIYWLHKRNKQYTNRYAKYIDVVMSICSLVESSVNYSKISGSLWQYYRDEPILNNDNSIIDFPANNIISAFFKFEQKMTGQNSFKGYSKMIAIDLSKQQELDADPKAIQQINFTQNIYNLNVTLFFFMEDVKQTISDFLQETVRVL